MAEWLELALFLKHVGGSIPAIIEIFLLKIFFKFFKFLKIFWQKWQVQLPKIFIVREITRSELPGEHNLKKYGDSQTLRVPCKPRLSRGLALAADNPRLSRGLAAA